MSRPGSKSIDQRIIENLLMILSHIYSDGVLHEADLFTQIHNLEDVSIYKLVTKGDRDKGTPFHSGSLTTHIVKEDYCEGELVYASIIHTEKEFRHV
jgi:hypothetical protein